MQFIFRKMRNIYKIPESVLVVIHTVDLEVLLIERADAPGFWQSVTGSKESLDEPLTATAIREVQEETGIRIIEEEHTARLHRPALDTNDNMHSVPLINLRAWQLSNVYEIYPVWRDRYAPGVTENVEHVFSLLVPRSIPIALAPREHVDHIWLPYRGAADKCFSPSNAEAILQLPRYAGPASA